MNYYRRYVGDYLRDTARLSLIEHGAYALMLDYYYADEKPLPLDLQELYTMVRAMRPEDRKAVDKVLGLFFRAGEDGYHQKRVDHEIGVSKQARLNGKGHTGKTTGLPTGTVTGSPTETTSGSGHPPSTNHQPLTTNAKPNSKPSAASEKISLSAEFEWEGVTDKRKALWAKAYPAVNLDAELASAAVWSMENPSNSKSNWGRFLTGWLKRAQDRAPAKGGGAVPAKVTTLTCEFRGDPVNMQLQPCGSGPAIKGSFYGGRALCEHHKRQIEDKASVRTGMPGDVREALNGLVKRKVAA